MSLSTSLRLQFNNSNKSLVNNIAKSLHTFSAVS